MNIIFKDKIPQHKEVTVREEQWPVSRGSFSLRNSGNAAAGNPWRTKERNFHGWRQSMEADGDGTGPPPAIALAA